MSGDGTETCYHCYLEAAQSDDLCRERIAKTLLFHLFHTGDAAEFERAEKDKYAGMVKRDWRDSVQVCADLAYDRSGGDDGKAFADPPDNSTEDGNDLMSEELRYNLSRCFTQAIGQI